MYDLYIANKNLLQINFKRYLIICIDLALADHYNKELLELNLYCKESWNT